MTTDIVKIAKLTAKQAARTEALAILRQPVVLGVVGLVLNDLAYSTGLYSSLADKSSYHEDWYFGSGFPALTGKTITPADAARAMRERNAWFIQTAAIAAAMGGGAGIGSLISAIKGGTP